jgi:hypothetical protein
MTVNVVMSGSSVRVLVDEQIPDGVLQGPPRKPGMFEQDDIDWGFKQPPEPQPLGDVNRQPVGIVQVAALKYVKNLIDQEIRRLEGQP